MKICNKNDLEKVEMEVGRLKLEAGNWETEPESWKKEPWSQKMEAWKRKDGHRESQNRATEPGLTMEVPGPGLGGAVRASAGRGQGEIY